MDGLKVAYGSLLPLLMCLCVCNASTPVIAWSNREVFSKESSGDVLNPYSLVTDVSDELRKLDFVIIFTAQKLDFDDIAVYGGLYGDSNDTPLASLQVAMTNAASSVWGGTDRSEILIDELPRYTFTSPFYLNDLSDIQQLRRTQFLQLLVVELQTSWNQKDDLMQHGSMIGQLMETMDDMSADYAAFYTSVPAVRRNKRSSPVLTESLSAHKNANETQVCDSTALISETDINGTVSYCTLMCMFATERAYASDNMMTNYTTLKAVYWPSWVEQSTSNDTTFCNMSTFNFNYSTASCNTSSLQDEFFTDHNITSSSITAHMEGNCSTVNDTENAEYIRLKVEFIFFGGGNEPKKPFPLPRKQLLLPGYWTMQLVVSNATDNDSNDTDHFYMTRFRTDLDLSTNTSNLTLTEKSGLFSPFVIPSDTSYSCLSHNAHLFLTHGNLNRFVATKIPFNYSDSANWTDIELADGPVLQFVGFHVQSAGYVYGSSPNTTLLSFSSVYYCEGYFDVSSWMGTFVVIVVTLMLYLATLAVFSAQTVDRFDDPRGQTISVENLH
jgi:hypothetical protein